MAYLDNFTDKTNSDNRFTQLFIDKEDEIVIGATCTHIFTFPFKYSEFVGEQGHLLFIYRQGITNILEKSEADCIIEEDDGPCGAFSKVTLVLSPEETRQFKYCNLSTFVQVKIIDKNYNILYNVPCLIIVKETFA